MSPPGQRSGPHSPAGAARIVAEVTTTSTATVLDWADARQRRTARAAHEHLRAAGLDSELVRRTLGVAG